MSESKATKVVSQPDQISPALNWLFECLTKGLAGGPVAVSVERYTEGRSLDQNAKQWAMYTDLSEQLVWHGSKLSPTEWKDLLSHDWQGQKIVPGISGGFCALGIKTSKLNKREFADLLEIVYAFGAQQGVQWSDKSLAVFDEYREAQK